MIKTEAVDFIARRMAATYESVPGVLVADLAVLTAHEAGCSVTVATQALAEATEARPRGGWQLRGRQAVDVAIMRDGLARAGRSRAEIDAAVARAMGPGGPLEVVP